MKTRMPQLPAVQMQYYPFMGGLDLETPPISVKPGKCFDAQNYEPNVSGGYRRIDGYERFDGRTTPTSASYWVMGYTLTGAIAVGNTVTGLTSTATGKVLGIFGTSLVLGRVTGTFVSGEFIQVGGITQATATSAAVLNGAPTPADNADYKLLAADDRRADILVVPGSGSITGVWVYGDTVYAFRNNAGGTAGDMYKSTSAGWVKIVFPREIQFSGAVGEIFTADSITGLTSGATAVVVRPLLRTGTWTVAGVGTLVLTSVVGAFVSGEAIRVGGATKVTSSTVDTAVTRLPNGRIEAVNANFTGSTATTRMYGVDGVNLGFEFDGTYYIPIRTGMPLDTPKHLAFHKNRLFYTFLGSLQFSSVGLPYTWTAVTGAGEIGMGEEITGILPQTGNSGGASLAVFTKRSTAVLYGSAAADFQLVTSIYEIGYSAYTLQPVSNNTYGLTARGIQALITTLNYGDFNFAAVSFLIQSQIGSKYGTEIASNTSRKRNEYRVFYTDSTGYAVGLTGDKVNGIMPLKYPVVVRCIVTNSLSTGEEVTYFGSDDGYIYQDSVGTSFDGANIEAWIRPVFNSIQSPRVRKRFRRATFEVKTDGYSEVNATYDLGYADADARPAAVQNDLLLVGAGGYWDQITWDQFTWDSAVVATPTLSIDGTADNISFLFYSNRNQDNSHTVGGVTIAYTPRRIDRG